LSSKKGIQFAKAIREGGFLHLCLCDLICFLIDEIQRPYATFSLDGKGGAKRSRLQRSGEKCSAQPKEKQVRAVVHRLSISRAYQLRIKPGFTSFVFLLPAVLSIFLIAASLRPPWNTRSE
jgi:hypothetical protein